jgi:translocation and assembly module TamB
MLTLHGVWYTLLLVASLCLIILLLLSLVFGSQWGREVMLDNVLRQVLSHNELSAEFIDIRSETLSYWQLGQFTLSYQGQTLVKLDELALQLSLDAIFDRELKLEVLRVGKLYLEVDSEKWPDSGDEADLDDTDLPEWLNAWKLSVLKVEANDIKVHHYSLAKNMVAGLSVEDFNLTNIAANEPRVSLANLDFNLENKSHWIKGSYLNDILIGQIKLDNYPLDVISTFIDEIDGGRLSIDLSLAGAIGSPHASGSIETSTTLLGLPFNAGSEVAYRDNNIQFSDFSGQWDSLYALGGGQVNLESKTLDVLLSKATMSSTFIEHLGLGLPQNLAFTLSAKALRVGGPFSDLHYQGSVHGLGKFEQAPLSLIADLKGNLSEVRVEQLKLESDDFKLEALGRVDFAGPLDIEGHYSGLAESTLYRLAPLLSVEELHHLTFSSSGEFHIEDTYDKPRYNASVNVSGDIKNLPFYLISQISGSLDALDVRQFELRQQRDATSPEMEVKGQVDLANASLNLNVETKNLSLSIANLVKQTLPEGLSGKLTSEVVVSGPWALPEITGKAHVKGHLKQRVFDADLDASFKKGFINIKDARIRSASFNAMVKGTAQLEGPLKLSGNFNGLTDQLIKLAVPQLLPERMIDLSFTSREELHVNGSVAQAQFTGELLVDGQYKQQALQIKSQFQSSATLFELQTLEIRRGPESLTKDLLLSGTVDFSRSQLELELEANALPIELISLTGIDLPPDLSGELYLKSKIKGPWMLPTVTAQGHMEGRYRDESYALVVDATLDNERIDIQQSKLVLGGKELLAINGYFGVEEQNLTISMQDINLKQLSKVGWKHAKGRFKASLNYKGNQQSSELKGSVDYRADWSWINAQAQRESSQVHFKTTIDTVDQIGHMDSRIVFQEKETSRLHIDVPLAPYRDWVLARLAKKTKIPLPTEFTLNGSLDLKALQALIENELESFGGLTELSLNAQGTRKKPKLNGELKLSNGYYRNEISGTDLTDIQLAVSLKDMSVKILKGEAKTPDNGTLKLAGEANWNDDKKVSLVLTALNAVLIERPEVEAALSGKLALEGDQHEYLLSGTVNLQPLMIKINSRFNSVPELDVQIITVDEDPDTLTRRIKAKAAPYPFKVELTVYAEQQAFLRGRGLEAELRGKVMIVGPASSLNYTGKFETIRGHLMLFNKRFELVKGSVSFDNANAILNIQAESNRQDITFKVSVSGTQDKLKLELTSEPTLPQDEVLARLLFGKSVKNMSPIQAVRLVTALQNLQGGNGLLPDPIDYARDLVGVDELNVESVETSEGTGVTVGVGKYLSEKVYLEVERTPDPNKPWQGRLDIELTPHLHLETTTSGSEGDEGIELFWKRDY